MSEIEKKDTKFKKGKSGNPNGRPKKMVHQVLSDLKEKGYKQVTPRDVRQTYETLMNLTRPELIAMGADDKQSIFIRVIARQLASGKSFETIEKMLDRAHGKPKQSIDHTSAGREMKAPIISFGKSKGNKSQ